MKKYLVSLLALVAISSLSLSAAPSKGGGFGTTAEVDQSSPSLRVHTATLTALPVLEITPVLTVRYDSPNFSGAMANLFADAEESGTLENIPFGMLPSSPTNYSTIPVGVAAPWYAFAYSEGDPMFAGVLNHPAPFDQEHGYTAGYLVRMHPSDGGEVSLSQLTLVKVFSNDGNSLGKTNALSNLAYSEFARGYNPNGEVINSGSGTQKVKEVRLFFYTFPYNGGGTQAGLDQIHNWIGARNFAVTFTVEAGSVSVSRTVETRPTAVPVPVLSTSMTSFGLRLTVSGAPGIVQSRTNLLTGQWSFVANVVPGSVVDVPATSAEHMKFFRVIGQ